MLTDKNLIEEMKLKINEILGFNIDEFKKI